MSGGTQHMEDVLRFLRLIWNGEPGVREIRIPKHNKYGNTASGYFSSPEAAAKAITRWDAKANIYVTLNPVKPALLARANERIEEKAESTTSDGDVVERQWLFIDIDPVRPAGISSTDGELAAARAMGADVRAYLSVGGWPAPIEGMSGNGCALYYSIQLKNDEEATALVKRLLEHLSATFSNDSTKIDASVYNASRIAAVIGTMKVKGDHMDERPHRRSALLAVPERLEPVPEDLLRALIAREGGAEETAAEATSQEPQAVGVGTLVEALQAAGIEYREQRPDAKGFTWYHVRRCPWHEDGPAFECGVGQKLPNGPYAGHCFHDRGRAKKWKDWKSALGLKVGKGDAFKLTDLGNAERLVSQFGDDLFYARALGWLHWDGRRWTRDEGAAERCAKATARRIWREVEHCKDDAFRKKLIQHASVSESAPRVAAMLQLARSDATIEIRAEDLDGDPWLLNVRNGTLDLKTLQLRPHSRADRISRLAPVTFDAEADCPLWRRFLDRATDGDVELQRFLQKAAGYALTGVSYEHLLFIFYGSGRNGKTTFLETLRKVLGDYGLNIAAETLATTKRSAGGPSEDLARLAGVRFVTAAETEDGVHLAEALIKRITGGDRVTARRPYARESIEFDPYAKIFLATNHKPIIRGTDKGIWARIRLVPWTVEVPEEEQDPQLLEKLLAEGSGILNWALEGLSFYQQDGHLRSPSAVAQATAAYREEMDTLCRFVETRCERGLEHEQKSGEFYAAYAKWCKSEGEVPSGQKTVSQRLVTEFGLGRRERNDGNYLLGVRIRPQEESTTDSKVEGVEGVEADRGSSSVTPPCGEDHESPSTSSTPSTPGEPIPLGQARWCPGCNERLTTQDKLCFRCRRAAS